MRRLGILAILWSAALSGSHASAEVPIALGVEGVWGHSADFGLGARLVVGLGGAVNWEVSGQFAYFLPVLVDYVELNYYEANANLVHNFYLGEESVRAFVGAGLNVARDRQTIEQNGKEQPIFEETKAGLNLLTGMRFGSGVRGFFFEARAEIGGGEQFLFTVGLRF